MFIVTGGAGFIGSTLVRALNDRGITDIWIVDEPSDGDQAANLDARLRTTRLPFGSVTIGTNSVRHFA